MARTAEGRANVYVDGQQAEQQLKTLSARASELRRELIAADKAGDLERTKKAEKSLKLVEKEMKQMKKEAFDVQKVLKNLDKTNFNNLNRASRQLTAELKKMERGTKEYVEKSKQLKLVNAELAKVKAQMQGINQSQQGGFFSKAANGLNKYFMLASTLIASFTGVVFGIKKAIETFNEFEAKLANLSALTGLTGEDLNWLGERAKQMSVSTNEAGVSITKSADEILEAFTIMGSAKPELLKNKEALAQVTEQALILAEAAKMETALAVESLAVVMNQFGAPADQAGKYINVLAAGSLEGAANVDQVADSILKFGAAANMANISVEESVGLVETLAERGLKGEIAGTGLRNVLLKLQTGADDTNPKIVGLEKALDNLNKKNLTAAELVEMFGKENFTVAQLLLTNTDRLKYFSEAVEGTNVAIEQANKNTSTNAAKLEQARNRAKLMAIELGEKLAPAMTFTTNTATLFIRALLTLIKFFQENGRIILTVSSAIMAYVAAVKIAKYWDNIHYYTLVLRDKITKVYSFSVGVLTGKINLATAATKAFNNANKGTIWGLIAAGIAGVIVYLSSLNEKLTISSKLSQSIREANASAARSFVEQRMELEKLVKVAKDDTRSKQERQAAINEINKLSPEYLGNLKLESFYTNEASDAINAYVENLQRKLKSEAIYEVLKKKMQELAELEETKSGTTMSDWEFFWKSILGNVNDIQEQMILNQKSAESDLQKEIDLLSEKYKEIMDEIEDAEDSRKPKEGEEKVIGDVLMVYKAGKWVEKDITSSASKSDGDNSLQTKLSELNQKAAELRRQSEIALMGQQQRELAIITDRYEKEMEQAGISFQQISALREKINQSGLDSLTKQERAQYDLFISINQAHMAEMDAKRREQLQKQMEHEQKMNQEYQTASDQLYEASLDPMDAELVSVMKKYEELIRMAEQYGFDVTAIKQREQKELTAITDKYSKQRQETERERDKAILDFKIQAATAATDILSSLMQIIGERNRKDTAFYKALGLTQLGVSLAVSIGKGIESAMSDQTTMTVWGKIAAAASVAATLIGTFASAYSILNDSSVPQYYTGRYDVIGASDGRHYNAPYKGKARTGIVEGPTLLAGDHGRELIVDYPTLQNIQLNAPGIIDAIMALRVPQYATGNYPSMSNDSRGSSDPISPLMIALFQKLMYRLDQPIDANVEYRKIKQVEEKETSAKERFS